MAKYEAVEAVRGTIDGIAFSFETEQAIDTEAKVLDHLIKSGKVRAVKADKAASKEGKK